MYILIVENSFIAQYNGKMFKVNVFLRMKLFEYTSCGSQSKKICISEKTLFRKMQFIVTYLYNFITICKNDYALRKDK